MHHCVLGRDEAVVDGGKMIVVCSAKEKGVVSDGVIVVVESSLLERVLKANNLSSTWIMRALRQGARMSLLVVTKSGIERCCEDVRIVMEKGVFRRRRQERML
ncbi:hypothetical protein ACH5RR_033827 [Cinchona calisaya]|uniref:Uncharacterized protein n=1 Tax=Cinchona calisaya TaxID=153742 RepID=A0ABD2YAE0_9GENT